MSDKIKINEPETDDKSFSDLLDTYSQENLKNSFEHLLDNYTTGIEHDIRVGELINGEIIAIERDTVFIDTKSKIDGTVEKKELVDENGNMPYNVGDHVELYVISINEGEIILSKAVSNAGGFNILNDAFSNSIPVEGKVIKTCKGGFHVEVVKKRAFCPASQIDLFLSDDDVYVGKTFNFLITQLEDQGKNIVLSRRKLLDIELSEERKQFTDNLSVGDEMAGTIRTIMPYGAFVELFPGIEGMVHISEIAWSRLETPDEILNPGDMVRVKIINIEKDNNNGKPSKISLSIKQTTANPWDVLNAEIKVGAKISGKVKKLTDFGAFVEIAPGIEGLVHISEMSYTKRIIHPSDILTSGTTVHVMIKEIDDAKKRISLSIRDAEGDPWIDISETYQINQKISGTIVRKEPFGYFINLSPGINGLLPKSKIKQSINSSSIEKLKAGDQLMVSIIDINVNDRKITFDLADQADRNDWQEFKTDTEQSFGTLGEKLQQALKTKQ